MISKAEEALQIAKRFIDAMCRRDGDGIVDLLHADVVQEFPFPLAAGEGKTGSRRQRGEGLRASLRTSLRTTEKIQFNNVVWRTTDDGAAVFEAEGECELGNGRPYRNRYIFIFEVSEGKISRWWEYLNPVISARAVGIPLESIP
jgi:ketosteroid isomerase-like protein